MIPPSADRTIRNRTAIAGLGATPFYKRGASKPQTLDELVCKAILAAVEDAGLDVGDIDGFAYFAGGFDTGSLMETLGIPEVSFSAMLTGTGGGSAGAVGLAAAAIVAGMAETVVCVGGNQQGDYRFGAITSSYPASPQNAFFAASGLVGPGHMFALLARRHMHLYGTSRDDFAEVALSIRANAVTNPEALIRKPMTREDYFAAPMIADPHCLYDFCLESDGAIAVIVTTAERARDLRNRPVKIVASAHGGARDWGRSIYWMNMPDEVLPRRGMKRSPDSCFTLRIYSPAISIVRRFMITSPARSSCSLKIMASAQGEKAAGLFPDGSIRLDGSLPVNTDGGQLSAGYVWGMSHVKEAVRQLRGTAANQLDDVRNILVTGGPSNLPVSGLVLGVES